MLLISTSCGITNNSVKEKNNDVGYSISQQSSDNTDINKYAEYGAPTGKWFLEGGGNIGFSISSGTMKPNKEVSVSLLAHPVDEVDLNKDVRFQLTKRDKDNKRIEIIKEKEVYIDSITSNKKYFSTMLPDKENNHYMLSIEILGEDAQVEDALVTSIYVPNQEINAALYLDKDQYTKKETLILKLDNNGSTNLTFGLPYEIEVYKQNKWEQISIHVGFDNIGLNLDPGQTFEQKVPLNRLNKTGIYRVIKDIDAEGTDLSDRVQVEFEIVD